MSFTGNENHDIDLATAAQMTAAYRATIQEGDVIGGFFGHQKIEEILAQENCVGFRYYFALNEQNLTIVLVGVDNEGNDIENGVLAEFSKSCPSQCSQVNQLNS